MNRKQKFKYLRYFIRENKVKDSNMKRGIYGSIFDLPKKVEKSLKRAKNKNHKEYMIRTFRKIAEKNNSVEVLKILSGREGEEITSSED